MAAVEAALRSVNLWTGGIGMQPCGTYSGGMKRRLSVAISLMGSPGVAYLDEPSTVRAGLANQGVGLNPLKQCKAGYLLWEAASQASSPEMLYNQGSWPLSGCGGCFMDNASSWLIVLHIA